MTKSQTEGKKEKAFSNWRHNSIHLTFPNGNKLSTVWGVGMYCDNHNIDMKLGINMWSTFLDSNTCEIMILEAPDKLVKKIHKKYDGDGSIIGYVTMAQWLDIVKILSK